jgi:phage terminase large subunit GpA-like protein
MEKLIFDCAEYGAQVAECLENFLTGFRPPPKRTVADWADDKRVLTSVASAESGKWRTDRTPYLREIMFELSPLSPAKEVAFKKASQIGGTEVGLNWLGQTIDEDPCAILIVQPTIKMGEKFSKQRVTPMIKACPDLLKKIPQKVNKAQSNTTLEKEFEGGILIIAGGNSASGLRSMPIKKLMLDEMDNYPEDADGEGDPVELAVARTETFSFSKIFYNSTPNLEETSRICKKFEEGDQRVYKVPCPHCGEAQTIEWERIKWRGETIAEKRASVHLVCVGCKGEILERHKTKMLAAGFWEPQNKNGAFPSFRINALYSPLGWYSWGKAVQDFYKAKGDPDKLKVFTNTKLGEAWSTEGNTVEYGTLLDRCEDYYADKKVPARGLILVASADVQQDRIEMEVVAWASNRENWSIEYKIIMGDPEKPEVWADLDAHLMQTYTHESGAVMGIAGAFIDAGNWQDQVLKFTRTRENRRIFGSKGRGGQGVPIINRPTRTNKQGAALYSVGVDIIKSGIYTALKYDEHGAGFCHFPRGRSEEYFLQLTAEKQIKTFVQGRSRLRWKKIRDRNEALDVRVYNIACLEMLNVPWSKLERMGPLTAQRLNPAVKKIARRRITLHKGVE